MNLKDAFTRFGLEVVFNGKPAKLLPLSPTLMNELDENALAATGQEIVAGQMLASWNEKAQDGRPAKRAGQVTTIGANNDITLMVRRLDGTEKAISANDLASGAAATIVAGREAAKNRIEVAEANEKARADYDAAIARGEQVDEPEMREPEFAEGAFAKFGNFVECVRAGWDATLADPLVDLPQRTKIHADMSMLNEVEADVLDYEQKSKVAEKNRIKQEIGLINPEHPDAADAILPEAYTGDNEAQRALMASLPITGRGHSLEQHRALRSVSPEMMDRLFKSVTTTPFHAISRRQLSHGDFQRVTQELARLEDREFGRAATARMGAITHDSMPGYRWAGRIFSKDDADALVMRDEVGAYIYTWDKASRVADLDVQAAFLRRATLADVPSDEELAALRATLADLTYDNGDEIDFAWDDAPVMEEDDDYGIGAGPRPEGYDE